MKSWFCCNNQSKIGIVTKMWTIKRQVCLFCERVNRFCYPWRPLIKWGEGTAISTLPDFFWNVDLIAQLSLNDIFHRLEKWRTLSGRKASILLTTKEDINRKNKWNITMPYDNVGNFISLCLHWVVNFYKTWWRWLPLCLMDWQGCPVVQLGKYFKIRSIVGSLE